MPIQKIKSGRIITVQSNTFVGEKGQLFYDEDLGDLRLSDGVTPGGRILIGNGAGGSGPRGDIGFTGSVGYVGSRGDIGPKGDTGAPGSGSGQSFKTIKVNGQSDLVSGIEDTLEIVAGEGVIIETNTTLSPYKTLTISKDNNVDGGTPFSVYGGIPSFDGGGI